MSKLTDFGPLAVYLNSVSEFHGETLCNALGHYFMNPQLWDCPEEGPLVLQMLTICDLCGRNTFVDDYDPVNNLEIIQRSLWPNVGSPYDLSPCDTAPSEEVTDHA